MHTISGDNAGLNLILGFVRSPSANHYCRVCTMSKEEIRLQTVEDILKICTISTYSENLKLTTIMKERVSYSGIRECSIFNNISYFHGTENFALDFMHDGIE